MLPKWRNDALVMERMASDGGVVEEEDAVKDLWSRRASIHHTEGEPPRGHSRVSLRGGHAGAVTKGEVEL